VLRLLSRAAAADSGLVSEQDDLVENQLPDGVGKGGREHARFLFMTVPCDRGTKSSALWGRAKSAFLAYPALFDLEAIAARPGRARPRIAALLSTTLRPRYVNLAADHWTANAARLVRQFGGDARKVFAADDALGTYGAIRSFRGFGPKTGGMMLRVAVGLGWASSRNIDRVELPVDIHDTRICAQTGIILLDRTKRAHLEANGAAGLAAPVRRFLTEMCAREGLAWPDLDRALWLIGSRGCARRRCSECPLSRVCDVPHS
jgi:endonuclease III